MLPSALRCWFPTRFTRHSPPLVSTTVPDPSSSTLPPPQVLVSQPDMTGRSLALLRKHLGMWQTVLRLSPAQLKRWGGGDVRQLAASRCLH